MVYCPETVVIGLVLIFVGGGGGVRLGSPQIGTISGGVGAVTLILGLYGVGC